MFWVKHVECLFVTSGVMHVFTHCECFKKKKKEINSPERSQVRLKSAAGSRVFWQVLRKKKNSHPNQVASTVGNVNMEKTPGASQTPGCCTERSHGSSLCCAAAGGGKRERYPKRLLDCELVVRYRQTWWECLRLWEKGKAKKKKKTSNNQDPSRWIVNAPIVRKCPAKCGSSPRMSCQLFCFFFSHKLKAASQFCRLLGFSSGRFWWQFDRDLLATCPLHTSELPKELQPARVLNQSSVLLGGEA